MPAGAVLLGARGEAWPGGGEPGTVTVCMHPGHCVGLPAYECGNFKYLLQIGHLNSIIGQALRKKKATPKVEGDLGIALIAASLAWAEGDPH
jgi:hypothetical protein